MKTKQGARNWAADDSGERICSHEPCHGPRTSVSREPALHVENHPGEETGFGSAQQEPHAVEAHGPTDEDHQARNNAPGDHEEGNPAAHSEFFEDQIAGKLKEEVSNEEHPGGATDHPFTQI